MAAPVTLESHDHRRLVDAMLALTGAEVRTHRDRYVRQLGHLIDGEPVFRRSDVPFTDLWGLVAACEEVPGALRLLPAAVAAVDGESPELDRFRALVAIHLPPEILTADERGRIVELADGLDPPVLLDLCRGAVARLGPRVRPPVTDLAAVLRELEDAISDPDVRPPLVAFLDDLAGRVALPARRIAGRLADEVARRMGVPPGPAAAPPPAGSAGGPRPSDGDQYRSYFVVLLDADGIDASRYLFEAWLVTPGDPGRLPWHWERVPDGPGDRFRLEQIQLKIDEALTELANRSTAEIGQLTVEFIVPRPLLDYEFDRWQVAAPGLYTALGVHYPVVVRDLTRMRNSLMRPRWRTRHRRLREQGSAVQARAVAFERLTEPYVAQHLHARLLGNDDYPVCLVLFVSGAERHIQAAIGAAVTAGLPVVLWCRDRAAASRFDSYIPEVLMARSVANLRELVWELRRDAGSEGGSSEHLGLHLTLLWDEIDRVPPADALSAPV
ncbi:hypothetical protein ADK66_09800 [Micromonospora sp. NRRL B-16802]|nr:hypothetical protein ADK66_09800 [Micromonospora sp. NRRL B-16802]